jgi:hypothetical protein
MQAGALSTAGGGTPGPGLLRPAPGTAPDLASSTSAPPSSPGCYAGTSQGQTSPVWKWRSVPCVSQAQSSGSIPPLPTEGGSHAGVPGLAVPLVSPTVPIVYEAYISITFSQFSGEYDSVNGSDAFSIQLNTNQFQNSTNQGNWVQFVEQNDPRADVRGCGTSCDCVWQVDLAETGDGSNPQGYYPTCVGTSLQTLSPTFQAGVEGRVQYTLLGCLVKPSYHCFWDYMLTSTYYTDGPGGGQAWSVTAPDDVGLHSNWEGVSGTILGYGGGSQAVFNHPTQLSTVLGEYANGLNSSTTYAYSGGSSGESNNLTPEWMSSPIFYGTDLADVFGDSGD